METVVRVIRKDDVGFDAEFRVKKSSAERFAALERMRNQVLTKMELDKDFKDFIGLLNDHDLNTW